MATVQKYEVCGRCGQEYLAEFSTKTGQTDRITACGCDLEIRRLEEKIKDEQQLSAILQDALECIIEVTEEDAKKIAQETLEAIAGRRT